MKLTATWIREGRGVEMGTYIAALRIGNASPDLIQAIGSGEWRVNAGAVSLLAVAGAGLVAFFVREGPYALATQPFDLTQITKIFTNRGVRLANLGYFGHMWELYAMWTWAPAYLAASMATRGTPLPVGVAAFVAIGVAGVAGCLLGGWLGDRVGRAR